ncbi:MAG: Uma2 family endonuclease [Acidobacteriota bacterium]
MVAVFESAAAPAMKPEVWTEQKLMQLPDDGNVYELVGGELAMSQAGFEHGDIAMLLGGSLSAYARERKLGRVVAASTGFWMKTGNARSPDVSFISKERLRGRRPTKKFFQGAPDLAVEVISPNDKWQEASKKVAELFANGTRLAWVVNPADQTVLVYHSAQPDRILKAGDLLDGEQVIPGFTFPVAELFAEYDFDTEPLEVEETFDEEDDNEEQD